MDVYHQIYYKDSLNFKINIEPKKLNEYISPDSELTPESSDYNDKESVYQ